MLRTALYAGGRIVVGDSHLAAYAQLKEAEKDAELVSGLFDPETNEFVAERRGDHFYDKEILLIRHGEPEAGTDPDLTPVGHAQVQHLCDFLHCHNVRGFSSPLLRCLRTAEILNNTLGISFTVMPELAESRINEDTHVPRRAEQFSRFCWPEDWSDGPETPWEFADRVQDALRQLPQASIVITHCDLICQMVCLALCEEKADVFASLGVPHASLTRINRSCVERLGRTDANTLHG